MNVGNFLNMLSCEFCEKKYCREHIFNKFHSCVLPLPSSQISVLSPDSVVISASKSSKKKKVVSVTKKKKHPPKKIVAAVAAIQTGRGTAFGSAEVEGKIQYYFYFSSLIC